MDATAARPRPQNQVPEAEYRAMCRDFTAREVAPRWAEADRKAEFPVAYYHAAAAAGLVGITAPEDLGGSALGATEEMICLEETCKVNPNLSVALIVQNIAGSLLHDYGAAQHREIAARNIAGECLLGIAVTEPEAGNDVQNVRTRAVREGDTWVLNGSKAFITLGGIADVLVLLAQTDPAQGRRGMRFFAVDRDSPGLVPKKMPMYANRPSPTYELSLTDVAVPESRRIDAGFSEIMAGFNRERLMVCGRWLGHMQHALAWGVEYAQTRHTFGRPIGANQSIAFQLAQCHLDVEAARRLSYHAAAQWDSGRPLREIIMDVSTAKLYVTQAVVRVTQTALHVGGGWALSEELPAMRRAIDSLVAPVTVGSTEIQLRIIARQMGLPCD
ncbi:MAG: acyl-CoA dehydrogenase family protein [Candidatus Lambdaproteobacteria bacterium]|nr:acyl-CoA dehydrogenase family protein [Candidatus Lambdaproteobacteria bacterium]